MKPCHKFKHIQNIIQSHAEKTTCRFNFPKPVSACIFICKTRECTRGAKKAKETGEQLDSGKKVIYTCLEDLEREMPRLQACSILTSVRKAMEKDEPSATVEELFDSLGINQELLEVAYRRLETKTKVVYPLFCVSFLLPFMVSVLVLNLKISCKTH